ncbi:uncharacterized protein LOC103389241 [Cynoglossus semilaevis]|uniref:uncharacterized protein LOC103389241 n=1 Tax=Cynoglossus semilaevis TaxID=244447 RepID=UPI0004976825|nr:uncharacterized protein LOC103389241 [Cynoglossus semilaevis]
MSPKGKMCFSNCDINATPVNWTHLNSGSNRGMISWLLQLFILIFSQHSSLCDPRTFEVSVSQSSYQEKENDNVTLEWTFTTSTNTSSNPLYVLCKLITHHKGAILYQLHESMEIPESQGQQFSGRVHCDKDVLGEGRIRLHLSRLRTEDAGWYVCSVWTNYGSSSKECELVVSEAERDVKPKKLPLEPDPWLRKRLGLIFSLGLVIAAAGLMVVCSFGLTKSKTKLSVTV